MGTAKVDSKKRIVLPNAKPGEVYDVQVHADGRLMLVRLETPRSAKKMSKQACLKAMENAPLTPILSWDELRAITREA